MPIVGQWNIQVLNDSLANVYAGTNPITWANLPLVLPYNGIEDGAYHGYLVKATHVETGQKFEKAFAKLCAPVGDSNTLRRIDVNYTPSSEGAAINLAQFGKFTLPVGLDVIFQGMRPQPYNPLEYGFTVISDDEMTPAERLTLLPQQRAIMVSASYLSNFPFYLAFAFIGSESPRPDGVSHAMFDPFYDTYSSFEYAVLNISGTCVKYADCPPSGDRATVKYIVTDFENVVYPEMKLKNGDGGSPPFLHPDSPGWSIPNGTPFELAARQEYANKYCYFFKKLREQVAASYTKIGTYNPSGNFDNLYAAGGAHNDSYGSNIGKIYLYEKTSNHSYTAGQTLKDLVDFRTEGGYFAPSEISNGKYLYRVIIEAEISKQWDSSKVNIPLRWPVCYDINTPVPAKVMEATFLFDIVMGQTPWLWDRSPNFNTGGYEGVIAALKRISMCSAFNGAGIPINPEISLNGGTTWVAYRGDAIETGALPAVRAYVNGNKMAVLAHNSVGTGSQTIHIRYNSWSDSFVLNGSEIYFAEVQDSRLIA